MARKGENIYHRKDGRWEGRYIKGRKPDGKPCFGSVYGKKYGEVKAKLTVLKARYKQEETTLAVYGSGSLDDWAQYAFTVLTKPYIKETTYALYVRSYEKHISPALGNQRISEITEANVQRLADRLSETLAPTTLHGVMRLLKSLLHTAVETTVIARNPYTRIRLPKVARKAPRVLTRREQRRVENAATEAGELQYLLCLYTGLRVGELCALRWSDFDFAGNCLTVSAAAKRVGAKDGARKTKLIVGSTKTEWSERMIPVPAFVMALMRARMQESNAQADGFVFQRRDGGCADPRTMQRGFTEMCVQLGIHGAHMHTLRHTYATRCLEMRVGYEVLAALLGHSSPRVTLERYAHCTEEAKRRSVAKLRPAA